MDKKITIFVNNNPTFIITVKENTTISEIKKSIETRIKGKYEENSLHGPVADRWLG